MIIYKDVNWIRRQVISMWYDHTHEEIAEVLGISVGSVNSTIQEYIKSNDWAPLVRDMLFSTKKNGIGISQVISNLRYENALKRLGSDQDKFDTLLRGLDHLMGQNEVDPQIAANLIYEIVEIGLREQKGLQQIVDDLRLKHEESQAAEGKLRLNCTVLENSNNSVDEQLEDNNVTIAELTAFREVREELGSYGITELDRVIKVLNNIEEYRGDTKKILEVMAKYFSANQECQEIERHVKEIQDQKLEGLGKLADIERESTIRQEAREIYKRLRNREYSDQGIVDALRVLEDAVLEYKEHAGPNTGNGFLAQLRHDISVFGSLLLANVNLQYSNNDLTFRLLHLDKQSNSPNMTRYPQL